MKPIGLPLAVFVTSLSAHSVWLDLDQKALEKAGKTARLITANGYNHFEAIETMDNPYRPLCRAALGQMGLPKRGKRPLQPDRLRQLDARKQYSKNRFR